MSDSPDNSLLRQFQLELFTSTKQLNLSEMYEAIPKEVAPDDPSIEWDGENLAFPVEKSFPSHEGMTLISEIKPATVKRRGAKVGKSQFPYFRELRVEHAIISLASKENYLYVEHGPGDVPSYYLRTTIYRIQKEIVEAINAQEGKNLSVNECPYNTTDIKHALTILKETNYTVHRADNGEKEYSFTRIKDLSRDGGNLIIELGTLISTYISRGTWNVVDSQYLLSSKTYSTLKLRTLLHLKFRYAKKGYSYNIALFNLIEKIGFKAYPAVRENIRKLTKILETLPEVESVKVDLKKDGRKIVDATFYIYPSEAFVQSVISSNKLRKRVDEALIDQDQLELVLEPLESDFATAKEYQEAKKAFEIKKGRVLHNRRLLSKP